MRKVLDETTGSASGPSRGDVIEVLWINVTRTLNMVARGDMDVM
jgi:hypothetical protein